MSDPRKKATMKNVILHGLSALIPLLILGAAFALHNIYPFGDRQILVTDYWHQYYPFLSDHWHRLREGGSFLWSWSAGGGHDYVAHYAYYMASPFNFLIALFPHAYLREVLTAFLLIKVGLAGLFMSFFLRFTLKKHDLLLPIFSSFYALCAYILGYYWNIMWMDTVALMPLVMLGVHALVREGKYRLYIGSLAVAVFSNFYIGLFVCIFVAIMFFVQSFVARLTWRQFFQRMVTIGICSLIAVGIAAILILPTYSALQNSYRSESAFPAFRIYDSFASVLGNFIAFTPPTSLDGLPNLYSGLLSVMLLPIFLGSKNISKREQVAYLFLVIFLVLSVNINVLDFIWNGFTVTNMLPFRFSFIASFVVVFMAYKAYLLMDDITMKDVLAMGASAILFHLMALIGEQEFTYIQYSFTLSMVYLTIFFFIFLTKKKQGFRYAIFLVVLVELAFTTYNGVNQVGTTDRIHFPNDYETVQLLLEARELSESDFVRTELVRPRTLNSPSLYGFDGLSFFSSLANVSATEFIEGIGLPGWPRGNRFTYMATTPLTNAFLNVRYVIATDTYPIGDSDFWELVASEGSNHLFRNNYHLPFGFMVNADIVYYVGDPRNPFNAQNELFRTATGIDEDLFTIIDIVHVGHRDFEVTRDGLGEYTFTLEEEAEGDGMFRFNYELPEDGPLYVYMNFPDTNNARSVIGSDRVQTFDIRRSYIFPAGTFEAGQIVSIEADSTSTGGTGRIFAATLNQELLDQGFDLLSAETLTLTEFSDTRLTGTITVSESGILYTSLPYAGNWRVFVNGTEEDIVTIGDAMAGVSLEPGTHTVEFRYHNTSVILGAVVSVVSLVLYAGLLWQGRKGKDVFESFFNRLFASEENTEKISYLFFGGMTTFINWLVYGFYIQIMGLSLTTSNIIAWVWAVTFAFAANKMWVFKDHEWKPAIVLPQVGAFLGARLVTGLIDMVGVPLLFFAGLNQSILGIEGFASKMVVSVAVVILNYVLSKKFVFKTSGGAEGVSEDE